MKLSITLPPIIKNGDLPIWEDGYFRIGKHTTKVLEYSTNEQGWNDNLTKFHEDMAGEDHFIDLASRGCALGEIIRNKPIEHPVILEIGCSSGFMLKQIKAAIPEAILIGSDVVYEPLEKLSKTLEDVPLLRFDLVNCPLPDNCVDVIVMLNVLEHIEDDQAALKQAMRILRPGGILVIEVPAGPKLYDVYDKILMHFRRYSLNRLCNLIQAQGLSIIKRSHLGFFFYPGFCLVKWRNKKLLKETISLQKDEVEKSIRRTGSKKFFHLIMRVELLLGRFLSYPFGIRCLVTCIKKDPR